MLKFKDVFAYVEQMKPIVIIFRDGSHEYLAEDDVFRGQKLMRVMDAPLAAKGGIGTFRFDIYAESDYLAFKLDCDRSMMID